MIILSASQPRARMVTSLRTSRSAHADQATITQRRVKTSSFRSARVVIIPTAQRFPVHLEIAAPLVLTRQNVLVVEATPAVASIRVLVPEVFTRDFVRSTVTRNVLTAKSSTRPVLRATASGLQRIPNAPMLPARTALFLVIIRTQRNVHAGLALKEVDRGILLRKSTRPASRYSALMAAQQLLATTVKLRHASAGVALLVAACSALQLASIRIAQLCLALRAPHGPQNVKMKLGNVLAGAVMLVAEHSYSRSANTLCVWLLPVLMANHLQRPTQACPHDANAGQAMWVEASRPNRTPRTLRAHRQSAHMARVHRQ